MIYKVTLNGKIYEVEVEKGEAVIQSEYEAALPQSAPAAATVAQAPVQTATPAQSAPAAAASANAIVAPMPGTINAVKVTSGQQVKKGEVLVILEAMEQGVPVISTNEGGIPDIIDNGNSGYTVEKNNPSSLASAIE